jgi:hypothetical protein
VNSNPSSHNAASPSKLAVILPSRGLMFSETFEELLNELEDFDYEIFWAHSRPLPDCFNEPLEKVLADPTVFAVLFCEDDMIIPKGILKQMFGANYPAVALDYPFREDGDATMLHDKAGEVIFSGTGFLLVAKAILESMPKPVFRTDTAWDMAFRSSGTMYIWPRKLNKVFYGLHDVYLGMMLFSNGIPIKELPRTAGQRKLVRLGRKETNDGAHEIKELTIVGRDMVGQSVTEGRGETLRQALNRVTDLEVLTEIPDFITYEDGQAVPKFKEQKYIIV